MRNSSLSQGSVTFGAGWIRVFFPIIHEIIEKLPLQEVHLPPTVETLSFRDHDRGALGRDFTGRSRQCFQTPMAARMKPADHCQCRVIKLYAARTALADQCHSLLPPRNTTWALLSWGTYLPSHHSFIVFKFSLPIRWQA